MGENWDLLEPHYRLELCRVCSLISIDRSIKELKHDLLYEMKEMRYIINRKLK